MDDVKLVAVDGRDALAYLIVRPKAGTDPAARDLNIESAATGLSYAEMAFLCGEIAGVYAKRAQAQEEARQAAHSEHQGWDRADFQCGTCGQKAGPFATELAFIAEFAEHKATCKGDGRG